MANLRCCLKAAIVCLILGVTLAAWADPPGRVGRISYIGGAVSFQSAADSQWTQAALNFPVTAGAAILTDANSLAEIQIGSSALRFDQATKLETAELDDHTIQILLNQGTLAVRLRNLDREDSFKVMTLDGVTVSLLSAGRYRVDAPRPNQPLRVTAFEGSVQIANDSSAVIVSEGKTTIVLGGTGLIRYEIREAIPVAFDDWAQSRDRGGAGDNSPQYVSQEMTGSEELGSYGQWSTDPEYGPVWYPYGMPVDWAPYRYGHWSWVEPWGWTWIDDAPWGFAPFHYGRWVFINSSWRWAPGRFIARPVFAPALVTFIQSPHFFVSFGSSPLVGWFPLAPGQVFIPAFPCSTVFLQKHNLPITSRLVTINTQNVNLTHRTLINSRFPPGVTVIPHSAFVKTLTVARSKIQLAANAPSPVLRVSTVPFRPVSPALVSASVNPVHNSTARSTSPAADPPAPSRAASAKQTLLNSNEWSRQNRVSRDTPATRQNPAPTLSQARSNAMQSPATSTPPGTWNSNTPRAITHVHTQSVLVSASVNPAHSSTVRSMLAAADPHAPSRVTSAKQTLLNSNEWSRQNRVSRDAPATLQNPAPTLSQVRSNAMQSAATSATPGTWSSNRVVTHVHTQSAPVTAPDHTPTPQAHSRPMPAQSAVMDHRASGAEHGRGHSSEATRSSVAKQPSSQPARRNSGFSSFRSPG